MKKLTVNKFTYTKPTGDVSDREVFIISVPNDMYFGIDISEYSEEEKEAYAEALNDIYEEYNVLLKEEIKQLGLSSNYRNFKADRIT